MRHTVISRTALAAAGVLAGACLLFAWIVRAGPDASERPAGPVPPAGSAPHAGGPLFEQHCSRCHTVEEMLASLGEVRAATEAGESVLELLDDHGTSAAPEDREIVEYLWTEVWRRRGDRTPGRR